MRFLGHTILSPMITDTVYGAASWDGEQFEALGTPDGPVYCNNFNCSSILAFAEFNGELIVGGSLTHQSNENIRGVARLVNGEWESLSEGARRADGSAAPVGAFIVENYGLLVSGTFTYLDSIYSPELGIWTGEAWEAFPVSFPLGEEGWSAGIAELIRYQGDLYAVGNFKVEIDGQFYHDIARFDGEQWSSPGGGILGGLGDIKSAVVYQDELYVGGQLRASDGNASNKIMKWNGEQWSAVGQGIDGVWTDAISMAVHDGYLYVVGVMFSVDGGLPALNLARWDGSQWCACLDFIDNRIGELASFQGDLILAGGFRYTGDSVVTLSIAKLSEEAEFACNEPVSTVQVEAEDQSSWRVFPNPTRGELTIRLPASMPLTASFEIFDALGRRLNTAAPTQRGRELVLDVSTVPAGMYYYRYLGFTGSFIKIN